MPKAIPDRLSLQLRINEKLHYKAKFIAGREHRTLNGQLEYFINKGIELYENENGKIEVSDEDAASS